MAASDFNIDEYIIDFQLKPAAANAAKDLREIARVALREAEQFDKVAEHGNTVPVAIDANARNIVSNLERTYAAYHEAIGMVKAMNLINRQTEDDA